MHNLVQRFSSELSGNLTIEFSKYSEIGISSVKLYHYRMQRDDIVYSENL